MKKHNTHLGLKKRNFVQSYGKEDHLRLDFDGILRGNDCEAEVRLSIIGEDAVLDQMLGFMPTGTTIKLTLQESDQTTVDDFAQDPGKSREIADNLPGSRPPVIYPVGDDPAEDTAGCSVCVGMTDWISLDGKKPDHHCPECGRRLTPEDDQEVELEEITCNDCGETFKWRSNELLGRIKAHMIDNHPDSEILKSDEYIDVDPIFPEDRPVEQQEYDPESSHDPEELEDPMDPPDPSDSDDPNWQGDGEDVEEWSVDDETELIEEIEEEINPTEEE